MDKVRFGRALGYGVRHATKAAVQAVDAATTPGTSRPASQPATASQPHTTPPGSPSSRPGATAASAQQQVQQAARTATSAAKQAGTIGRAASRSFFGPLARVGGVLWLQVMGSIYAMMALVFGEAAYLRRAALHRPLHEPHAQQAWLLTALGLLFSYFAVTSFVRAAVRERRS
jgi:hypothetical protein